MKKKVQYIILLKIFISANIFAQCTIPNGDFESWTLHEEGIAGGGDYWMPDGDWNENIGNIATRFYLGRGYFYRYEETDANGYALKLGASSMFANGFIRFQCDEVPEKLKGRYKFSNTGCDDFTIYAYAVNRVDTLTLEQLYQGAVHSSAESFVAPITESFQDFEIDLSDFKDVDIDYFVIMLQTTLNYSCLESMPMGDVGKSDPDGFAVIDDLELVYDAALSINDKGKQEKKVWVFPNPVKEVLQVKYREQENNNHVQLFNAMGKLLYSKQMEQQLITIDMHNYSPGIYMLQILNGDTKEMIKIVKQ